MVGRDSPDVRSNLDVIFNNKDNEVSRKHCVIELCGVYGYRIIDLGSFLGTKILLHPRG